MKKVVKFGGSSLHALYDAVSSSRVGDEDEIFVKIPLVPRADHDAGDLLLHAALPFCCNRGHDAGDLLLRYTSFLL